MQVSNDEGLLISSDIMYHWGILDPLQSKLVSLAQADGLMLMDRFECDALRWETKCPQGEGM